MFERRGRPVRNAASETLNATWLMRLGVRFDSSFVPRPSHKTKSLDGLFAISPALPSCLGFLLCTQQVSQVFHPSHVSTKCRVEWWTTLSNPVAFTNTYRCVALRCGGMHIPVFWKPLLIKTCSGLQFDSMQTNINNNCCQISLTLFLIMRPPCKNKQ